MSVEEVNEGDEEEGPRKRPLRHGVAGIIVRDERLLVIRRSSHVAAPGRLCFPGGGIEESETETAALTRELAEELGVVAQPVRCVWRSVTAWRVSLSWWLTELDEGAVLTPNPAEVASIHWLTPAELADEPTLLESNFKFLKALARREITLEEK